MARLVALKDHPAARWLKRRLQDDTKLALKQSLARLRGFAARRATDWVPVPHVTRGLWWLQTTRYLLATRKFDDAFGALPLTYREGLARTGAWLRFAGYGG